MLSLRKQDPNYCALSQSLHEQSPNSKQPSWGLSCVSLNTDELPRAHQPNAMRQVRRASFAHHLAKVIRRQ